MPFHGIVNEIGAEDTLLSGTDVERLNSLLWRSLKNQTMTRSKIGHRPRLYLRVEYDTNAFHTGTLDDGLEFTQEADDTEFRKITDVSLSVDDLIQDLEDCRAHRKGPRHRRPPPHRQG